MPVQMRLSGIGREHSAWFSALLQRQRVEAIFVQPEVSVEALFQVGSLLLQLGSSFLVTGSPVKVGYFTFGVVSITLHLHECYGGPGQAAVGVDYGIARVFPALVCEAPSSLVPRALS